MSKSISFNVKNMVCTSCERIIEEELSEVNGVAEVKADYSSGKVRITYDEDKVSLKHIFKRINKLGYEVKEESDEENKEWLYIVLIIFLGLIILRLGKNVGTFNISDKLSEGVTFIGLFIIGIFTSLHCVGMCGGIAISQGITIETNKKFDKIKPTLMYNIGRLISYTALGGMVGALGSVFTVSIKIQAFITLVAGVFMILWGFNTFGFKSFRRFSLKLNKSKMGSGKSPFVVGLLNGFMPCGPLQAMQLYALTTGSIVKGALSMFFFGFGTIPLMLFFGLVASGLNRKNSKRLIMASGLLVIYLGLTMSLRGLNLIGINFGSITDVFASKENLSKNVPVGSKAVIENGKQVITITASQNGYTPRTVYVEDGVPTEIVFKGESLNSCNNEIIIPSLNVRKKLSRGETKIEFTPNGKDINYSCWMGMITGKIKIVESLNEIAEDDSVREETQQTPSCCATGGGVEPTFYGIPISQVETNRLIKKANYDEGNKVQKLDVTSDNRNFEPAVILLRENTPFEFNIDLGSERALDGDYYLMDMALGNKVFEFGISDGKGVFGGGPLEEGVYGVFKGNDLYIIIEVVKGDINSVDLEYIRGKYF